MWSGMLSGVISAIFVGAFFRLLDLVYKQRELLALLYAFQNECKYNIVKRGNSKVPFQLSWLVSISRNLNFYEQCPDIATISLDAYELAKDMNTGFSTRTYENGVKLVIRTIQDMFEEIELKIEDALPMLKKRTSILGYLCWWLFLSRCKKTN